MRRPIAPIILVVGSLPLLLSAAGCAGGSSGAATAGRPVVAPFSAPIDFEGGAGSGLWGDGSSGPSGTGLGCLRGRRYPVAVTLRNRGSATVTITGVSGPDPAPRIIRRVAVQVRLAPPEEPGDAVGPPNLHAWSAAALVPVAIPPGKRAVVQSNFLIRRCDDLRPHQALVANRRIVVAFRVGAHRGRQTIAATASRIILTRGPTIQRCAPPRGATGLTAWDVSCGMAANAAAACHRLAHGTEGSCTATLRRWDCTFESASRAVERCRLPSKRQSLRVRWR